MHLTFAPQVDSLIPCNHRNCRLIAGETFALSVEQPNSLLPCMIMTFSPRQRSETAISERSYKLRLDLNQVRRSAPNMGLLVERIMADGTLISE